MNSFSVNENHNDIELAVNHILIGIPRCIKCIKTKSVYVSWERMQWNDGHPFFTSAGIELMPFSHYYNLYIYLEENPSFHNALPSNLPCEVPCKNFHKDYLNEKLLPICKNIDVETVSPFHSQIGMNSELSKQRYFKKLQSTPLVREQKPKKRKTRVIDYEVEESTSDDKENRKPQNFKQIRHRRKSAANRKNAKVMKLESELKQPDSQSSRCSIS